MAELIAPQGPAVWCTAIGRSGGALPPGQTCCLAKPDTILAAQLLNYQDEMIDFLNKIVALTYSESGWGWSGRIINRILINLTSTCATEDRIVNPEEWQSGSEHDRFRRREIGGQRKVCSFPILPRRILGRALRLLKSQGRLACPKSARSGSRSSCHLLLSANQDVSRAEVDFALRIVKEVLSGPLCNLESLVATQDAKDQVWHNEFCRYLNHVRNGLSALNTLCLEYPEDKTGGKPGRDLA